MIKKTLYFGNPAYLSMRSKQLVVGIPDSQGMDERVGNTIPIEDVGVVVLDHKQITITHGLMESLLANNVALVTCDSTHHPVGLMLPLAGNHVQAERYRHQLDASEPLKKQLWQQTVMAKISNQASLLQQNHDVNIRNMQRWAGEVKSGDTDNYEARAAAYYWSKLFPLLSDFKRGREELPPNNLLNYGYAILRAVVARALVATGLLATQGIHHRNKYNAYCLADDIMEPYRPYVDRVVLSIVQNGEDYNELNSSIKRQLLSIPQLDVMIAGRKSPLMLGVTQTTASLYKCFVGEERKLSYPAL